jgi:hypothetical protein
MKSNNDSSGISRRTFLVFVTASLGLMNFATAAGRKPMASVAPFVKPKLKWTPEDFYRFLTTLPPDARLALKKSLDLLKPESKVSDLKTADKDAQDIQKKVLWLSSNILMYPFKSASKLDYHRLVSWASGKAGVPKELIQDRSTFFLERELFKLLFVQLWDKLNAQQRQDLLVKIDPNGSIKDKAAVAALGGAGAMAALSTTVAFSGFAFYTAMSAAIAAVAAAMGVTLPFAAYAGAATAVGVLAGPIGWAIAGVAALGGIALAGRADFQKTTAFVAQIHALKVEALMAAGVREKDVFTR